MVYKTYFGAPGNIREIPAPASGMGFNIESDTEETALASGGRAVYRAPTTYKTLNLNWASYSSKLQHIIDMCGGSWGRGPFYITDPTTSEYNVLPARWSNGWQLAYQANGWCKPFVADANFPSPSPFSYSSPISAVFTQASAGTPALEGKLRTRVIRVPGQPYYLTVDASLTGTAGAGFKVRGLNVNTNVWDTLTTVTTFNTSVLVLAAADTTYTMLELDMYMPVGSRLTVRGLALGTYAADFINNVIRTNLATNPNMEAAGALVTVRTNYCLNPRAVTATLWTYQLGTSEVATQTLETGAGPNGLNGFIRRTITTAKTGGNSGHYRNEVGPSGVSGDSATGSLWVRSSAAITLTLNTTFRLAAATVNSITGAAVLLVPNVWTELRTTGVATGTFDGLQVWAVIGGSNIVPIGGTIDATQMLIEKNAADGKFYDGAAPASGDYTYSWSGTANASTSVAKVYQCTGINGVMGTGGIGYVHRTADSPYSGSYASRQLWTKGSQSGSGGMIYQHTESGEAGDTRSVRVFVRPSTAKSTVLLFRFRNNTTIVGTAQTAYFVLDPNVWTEFVVEGLVATGPYTNIQVYVLLHGSVVNYPGDTLDMDAVILEPAATAGTYFDGNTVDGNGLYYNWTTNANASSSVVSTSPKPTYITAGQGIGPIQYTSGLKGNLTSKAIDRIGMSLDFTEVQGVEGSSS